MSKNKRTDILILFINDCRKRKLKPIVYKNLYIRNLSIEYTLIFPFENLMIIHSRYTQQRTIYKIYSLNQLYVILIYYCIITKDIESDKLQILLNKWEYKLS